MCYTYLHLCRYFFNIKDVAECGLTTDLWRPFVEFRHVMQHTVGSMATSVRTTFTIGYDSPLVSGGANQQPLQTDAHYCLQIKL
jgi:hypothetical protein